MPPEDKDQDQPSNKELRDKLEAALKQVKDLTASNQTLIAANLMPHLNERQRRVVMRELQESNQDVNADTVAEVAEDLGYSLDPTPPTPPILPVETASTANGNEQVLPPGSDSQQPPPEIMVSLNEMNAIDQANYNARRGNLNQDLETEMRNAKSREELRNIVRTKGAASGLVHEWDDQ